MQAATRPSTPWRRAVTAFGVTRRELSGIICRDSSVISRGVTDPDGLINAGIQRAILRAARRMSIPLNPLDLLPDD